MPLCPVFPGNTKCWDGLRSGGPRLQTRGALRRTYAARTAPPPAEIVLAESKMDRSTAPRETPAQPLRIDPVSVRRNPCPNGFRQYQAEEGGTSAPWHARLREAAMTERWRKNNCVAGAQDS